MLEKVLDIGLKTDIVLAYWIKNKCQKKDIKL